MARQLYSRPQRHSLWVMIACVQFVVLTFVAMLFYPGGTMADPTASGYPFLNNLFGDLGWTQTRAGQPNTVSAILMGVRNLHMGDRPYGPAVIQFRSGTTVVYVVFDYSDMQGEEVTVRVYDQMGSILFGQVEAYTGSGTESIEVSGPKGGAFADGWYVTNLYSDSILFPIESVMWEVGQTTIPTYTPTSTSTVTPTPTDTLTPTATPTVYYDFVPLVIKMPPTTPTATPTVTPTPTSTSSATATPTPTPTATVPF
jgi:hypothetical protein